MPQDQQRSLLKIIEQVHRDTDMPVSTIAIATRYCVSDRQARRYMNALERAGVVRRIGQRKGWLLAA